MNEFELTKYRWFAKKEWQEELRRMLASGLKYGPDAFANKGFRYLTKTLIESAAWPKTSC